MITIVIFTKVLATKTVANSNLGFSISSIIFLLPEVLKSLISEICVGVSEKKAISEPAIIAEHNNNKAITKKLNTMFSGKKVFIDRIVNSKVESMFISVICFQN